jgi:hypothetical protein
MYMVEGLCDIAFSGYTLQGILGLFHSAVSMSPPLREFGFASAAAQKLCDNHGYGKYR